MPILHKHLTTIPDDPNYDVSQSEWNDEHVVSGGVNGDVMVRDTFATGGWSLTSSPVMTSPNLTGTPTAPTAAVGTNTTQIATTAFVIANMAAVGAGNVVGAASSVDGMVALFSGTTGRILKTVTPTWAISAAGLFYPTTDNAIDIGQFANRVRGIVVGTHVTIGSGSAASVGAIRLDNNTGVFSRNAADSGNLQSVLRSNTNTLLVGDVTAPTLLHGSTVTLRAATQLDIQDVAGSSTAYSFNDIRFFPTPTGVRELGGNANYWLRGYFVNVEATGYFEGVEIAAPLTPSANRGRLYFDDNGAGKTRLMVVFNTGAAQQIAIQP